MNVVIINLFSVGEKIYEGILVDRVHRVTEGLIDDEQGGFRAGRGSVFHTKADRRESTGEKL